MDEKPPGPVPGRFFSASLSLTSFAAVPTTRDEPSASARCHSEEARAAPALPRHHPATEESSRLGQVVRSPARIPPSEFVSIQKGARWNLPRLDARAPTEESGRRSARSPPPPDRDRGRPGAGRGATRFFGRARNDVHHSGHGRRGLRMTGRRRARRRGRGPYQPRGQAPPRTACSNATTTSAKPAPNVRVIAAPYAAGSRRTASRNAKNRSRP